jgi:hypothetical protein
MARFLKRTSPQELAGMLIRKAAQIARLCDAGLIEEYPLDTFKPIAERLTDMAPMARRFGERIV